ncbi:reverse transcriptase [Senna tora]|uniref:Reverse transcriptase n=1 Tax=Senna tora TaxID=362788 RepID=A0A834U2W2_9FABA|nr:reverse transcriptase [Senna tora]
MGISEEDNEGLMRRVSEDEVRRAAFDLGAMKAPGPDGFSGKFCHSAWSVVGDQVVSSIMEFLNGNGSIEGLNETNIVIIPKVDKPESVKQYRPISLCNFSYKIVFKVMVNRLKNILPRIVSEQQRAFVKGRLIQDNIVIAHEVYHYSKNRASKGRFELAMKIDMAKAYDRVEWDFLEKVLLKLGFCDGWVRKVMMCVKSVKYNVLVGGRLVADFVPKRGLRQDDSLLFLNASKGDCEVVADILRRYCEASGISEACNPDRYLGLPTLWERSKKVALSFVKDKMMRKIEGWKYNTLSQAGREVLIKSVAATVPGFSMGIFKFPKGFCKELDAALARFWWGSKNGEGKIHWKAWSKLTRPKRDGGLGFREFEAFNNALLAKMAWRLVTFPNELWARVIKGIYFPNMDFLIAKKGSRASWGWSSLLVGRDTLMLGLGWKLGNGESIKISSDKWLPSLENFHINSPLPSQEWVDKRVASIIVNGKWSLGLLKNVLSKEEVAAIESLPVPCSVFQDEKAWLYENRGEYSVKTGYHVAKGRLDVAVSSKPSSSFVIPAGL